MESKNEARAQQSAFLDVPSEKHHLPDDEVKELYAYGAGLHSLTEIISLSRFDNLEFLSLHGNHIESMKGLEKLRLLKELNLSSNHIRQMEGLSHLVELLVLNLSCNQIEEITDVNGLLALRKLILSHNQIKHLTGLSALHGPRYSLQILDLRDNLVSSLSELDVLAGCIYLMDLVFSWGSYSNPICQAPAYKSAVVAAVPHILKLDGQHLHSGSQAVPICDGIFLSGGTVENGGATPVLPLWALQNKCDNLQDPVLQRLDINDLSPHVDGHSQPWKVFPQEASQVPICSNQNHQKIWPWVSHPRDNSANHGCQNPRHVHPTAATPSAQPSIVRCCCQHDIRESTTFPGQAQQPFEWQGQPCVENCIRIDQSRPNMISVPTLSHSEIDRIGHTRLGQERRKANVVPVAVVPKVDGASQTNYEDCFGVLEGRIQDLVQQLTFLKTYPEEEINTYSDNDELNILSGSKSQRLDTFGQFRREHRGNYSKSRQHTTDISSGDYLDACKPKSNTLDGDLFSKVDTDSNSNTPEWESSTRRWVHFADRWKRLKDLTKPRRESGSDGDEDQEDFKHLREEVKCLQVHLASLTAKHLEMEEVRKKSMDLAEMKTQSEQVEKDNRLSRLMKECSLLESQLENSKEKFSEERSDFHKQLEEKQTTILKLERIMQDKDERVQELSNQMEIVSAEKAQQASCIQEIFHGKINTLSTEISAMKKALAVATQAQQNTERSLLHATSEKENSKKLAISIKQALQEENAKLKVCKSELETCKSHELELQKELEKCSKNCLDSQTEKLTALEQIRKHHEEEIRYVIARESAAGESRGMYLAEKSFEQLRNSMKEKVLKVQTELEEVLQERSRIRQDMDNLREEKEKTEAELKETIRCLLLKEQGKDGLIIELSSVVHAQKLKLQSVHLDLERLIETEEDLQKLHQEIINFRHKAEKYDALVLEVGSLRQALKEVTCKAEMEKKSADEEFLVQLTSLQQENKSLTAALEKLKESEDAVKIKNKMLESQNDTIKELKEELSQLREALKLAGKSCEALEAEWSHRLQIAIDQEEGLQNKLANQTLSVSDLEEKLRVENAARIAAEKTCRGLQETLTQKEDMFRYVEDEILQVKELYNKKVRTVGTERDQAYEALKTSQKEKEKLEIALKTAQRREQELLETRKALQVREEIMRAEGEEKDLQLGEASQRILEFEAKLKSQLLAMESQKVASTSKLDQLRRLLEEPGDVNYGNPSIVGHNLT